MSTRECSSNERLRSRGGGGGGGTLIFSYIRRRLGPFNWGLKILNFNIFFGFQKSEYFGGGGGGYEEYFLGVLEIPDIFGGEG